METTRHWLTATLIAAALAATPIFPAVAAPEVAPEPGHWVLNDLYASPQAWQTAFDKTQNAIDALPELADTLTDDPATLADGLARIDKVHKRLARLATYAHLAADVDLRAADAQERRGRVDRLQADFGQATGFVEPALVALGAQTLKDWADRPVLAEQAHYLTHVARQAPHTLTRETESALAALSPIAGQSDTFDLLSNADIAWPRVTLDGKPRTLDQAAYTRWRADSDRATRQKVFKAFWSTYNQYEDTFGSLLNQAVYGHVINARLHHYDSALAAALAANDIPVAVYHQLIDSVDSHLDTLHRYLKLRARLLGVDQLHYYDIYPPLVASPREFDLDDAKTLLEEATRPLGPAYTRRVATATSAPWTSAYPAPGKRPGAYMNGSAYDVHPYVLMNFQGDYDSVSTYAHEWGHGVHSMLANTAQPYATADYPIFTAEVASTTNEALLIDHMIDNADSRQEKLFYIGQALESLRGTFFRQAQFAEFELALHKAAQAGQSLSGERISTLYKKILDRYYGVADGVTAIDERMAIEWAYVPHFYYNFYVYQYATSIAAGEYFASRILAGDTDVRDAYLAALSAGGSASGYDILKNAGVDLATAAPYNQLIQRMNELMDQAEDLLDKRQG